MTKPNSIVNPPPVKAVLHPTVAKVKPFREVTIDENNAAHINYNDKEAIEYCSNMICCPDDITGAARKDVLQIELQLRYESQVVFNVLIPQKRNNEQAALLIDMAQRSEALALKYADLYQGEANKQAVITLIYSTHTYMYYARAVVCLKKMLEKQANTNSTWVAQMLLLAHSKTLATAIVEQNTMLIDRAKQDGKSIDELITNAGLEFMLDKPTDPKPEISTALTIATLFANFKAKFWGANDLMRVTSESSVEASPLVTVRKKFN